MSTLTDAPRSDFVPEYVHYTDADFRAEFAADMTRESALQARHPSGRLALHYDPQEFDFRQEVRRALIAAGLLASSRDRGDLEGLHESIASEHQAMDASQQSSAARALYGMPATFAPIYSGFLAQVVAPALGLGAVHCQVVPTFRVFFPEAQGYPGATTYHNDIMLGHSPREVNVFVPLVRCEGTRSLLLASLDDSLELLSEYDGDFARFGRDTQQDARIMARCAEICRPLEVDVGTAVVFDSRCLHAGPANTTPMTRVTFDSRVLPTSEFASQRNQYRGLGRRRAEFAPGAYFAADPVG